MSSVNGIAIYNNNNRVVYIIIRYDDIHNNIYSRKCCNNIYTHIVSPIILYSSNFLNTQPDYIIATGIFPLSIAALWCLYIIISNSLMIYIVLLLFTQCCCCCLYNVCLYCLRLVIVAISIVLPVSVEHPTLASGYYY